MTVITSKAINTLRSLRLNNFKRNFSLGSSRKMKLVQFSYKNKPDEIRVGYIDLNRESSFVDINEASRDLPSTLLGILQTNALEKVKKLPTLNPEVKSLDDVNIRAPITGMDKILCIGLNYKDHCEEQNLTPPKTPMIFSKFASCVIGQSEPLRLRSTVTQKVDWEVELVAVIGKKASFVKAVDANQYILGYTVGQDISARDWQKEKNGGQFVLGKAMDGFSPIGPWIVTSDEIDPDNVSITCSLNGVNKQSSNTSNIIHKIPDVIERLSSVLTLLPGDIIFTGTPSGVGMHRSPPEYLKAGDVLVSEIQNIGSLTTRCVEFDDKV